MVYFTIWGGLDPNHKLISQRWKRRIWYFSVSFQNDGSAESQVAKRWVHLYAGRFTVSELVRIQGFVVGQGNGHSARWAAVQRCLFLPLGTFLRHMQSTVFCQRFVMDVCRVRENADCAVFDGMLIFSTRSVWWIFNGQVWRGGAFWRSELFAENIFEGMGFDGWLAAEWFLTTRCFVVFWWRVDKMAGRPVFSEV